MANKTETKNKNGRRGYDILAKVLCLLAAIILWFYVSNVETTEYESTFKGVSVELINTSVLEGESGLSVYSGYGNTVDVTVSGKKSIINKYSAADIRVYADVTGIESSGRHYVTITAEAPSGLKVTSLSTSSVSVYVDEIITVDVDVVTRIRNSVIPSDCVLGDPIPEFSTISVTGPKATLNNLECAEVILDLGSVTSTVTTTQAPVLKDKSGNTVTSQYVKMQYSEIKVTVPVVTTKTVPLRVELKNGYYNSTNSSITINPETLTVKGDPKTLESLNFITVAVLDEKKIMEDVTQHHLIELPEGVTSTDNVDNVEVSVKHMGTIIRHYNIDTDEIVVTGAGDKEYEIIEGTFTIDIRGTRTALTKVTAKNVKVTVDLSRFADVTGTTSVTASVTVEGENENLYPIGEYTVQVELK